MKPPVVHLTSLVLPSTPNTTRSRILSLLCVGLSSHCPRHKAYIISRKVITSASSSLLTCMLKPPISMILEYFVIISTINGVNSSKNLVTVLPFLTDYGGLYTPTIMRTMSLHTSAFHTCASNIFSSAKVNALTLYLSLDTSAIPLPCSLFCSSCRF